MVYNTFVILAADCRAKNRSSLDYLVEGRKTSKVDRVCKNNQIPIAHGLAISDKASDYPSTGGFAKTRRT